MKKKKNRYRKAIVAATRVLELRKQIQAQLEIIRQSLTVDEVLGGYFDCDELKGAFEGKHVLAHTGYIEKASYVKSKYVCGDISVCLHVEADEAQGAVIRRLLEEINTAHLLRK